MNFELTRFEAPTMGEALQQIRQAFEANDLDGLVTADSAFHLAIVQASHNDVLVEMLRSIDGLVRPAVLLRNPDPAARTSWAKRLITEDDAPC